MLLYVVVVVILAAATIIEKYEGTTFVSHHVYGAWWFSLLWSLLTAVAVFYFIKQRVRRASTIALHLSFVIILAGALLTHLTSEQGIIHLREGEPVNHYITPDMHIKQLPFSICLQHFQIDYHEGTHAPADFISDITIDGEKALVSMNKIASHQGIRLYQNSYDADMHGTVLAMNSDPWGIPVTYCGYALLFVSLIWILIDPRGTYRSLLRRISAVAILSFLVCSDSIAAPSASPNPSAPSASPRALPQETAEHFGQLFVVYNNRVCPMETYALDFTKKLTGRRSYRDYSALQVLTGFIFFYDDWADEAVIRIKDSDMKHRLNLSDHVSLNSLFTDKGYRLGPYLDQKDIQKIDERVTLIMQLHEGTPLRIFPYQSHERITWYAPTSTLPADMDPEHEKYMREVLSLLNGEVQASHYGRANEYLARLLQYQQTFGKESLPIPLRVKAEYIYNKVPFATILFMVCLTLGVLSFLLLFRKQGEKGMSLLFTIFHLVLAVSFLALTVCLALRWTITGHIPMANGYETMLFLAWAIQLLSLLTIRRQPVMLTFGLLLSGFFLLVSHLSMMDPQISHLMPVLNSPLLTLHVSIIMMAYALLSLTFMSSITALIMPRRAEQLQLLSMLMLYPALTCLGFGIFIGAIWANVSWGNYWSWDPKETWALITFMVYAVPVHKGLNWRPRVVSIYLVFAFLTILMTYFGVNYFLGGMHSYA